MPVHKHKLAPPIRKAGRTEHVIVEAPLTGRDLTAIRKYRHETTLTLRRIQAESLEFISDWAGLRSLRLYGCKIRDCSALARFKRLEHLFINTIRARAPDLSFLSQLRPLKDLGIGHIPHLTTFPDMSRCTRLKRLSIFSCKRLTDLSAILHIPNLESFHILLTPQGPADLEPIMALPRMKFMTGQFGSSKRNALFRELLEKHGVVDGV